MECVHPRSRKPVIPSHERVPPVIARLTLIMAGRQQTHGRPPQPQRPNCQQAHATLND